MPTVSGFLPSTSAFHFSNDNWPHVPDYHIRLGAIDIPIGDAANGLCGGMAFAAKDFFDAGAEIPPDTENPSAGPLFDYIARRLLDSFNLVQPIPGPAIYLSLMDPALPDHETWASSIGLAPHGRAWVMINQEWPKIKADLDSGMLSPLGLIEIKSLNPFDLGHNHQVLAYGYDLDGSQLTIHLYDPNFPDNDNVRMSLDISDPAHTTPVTYSQSGSTVFCFFRVSYLFSAPLSIADAWLVPAGDFDGDRKTDLAVWRPTDGCWEVVHSSDQSQVTQQWGEPGDIPVPGDYDGDGRTDFAVWRPSEGNWYVIHSSDQSQAVQQWGEPGDIPVPADYDGDGRTDFAVWRPSEGNWYVIHSSNQSQTVKQWGLMGDIPVPGDYDGDKHSDFAVWRPNEGNWYVIQSSDGSSSIRQWGLPRDIPVPADYDGDGKTDFAVWRPYEGNWYVIHSSDGSSMVRQWGLPGDIPVEGDYDGDGHADFAIWRPREGTWYVTNDSTGQQTIQHLGQAADIPV